MNKSISILIFAFNEEGNIQDAIDSVVASVDGLFDDYEIIVIDDGSQDKTGDRALEKAQKDSRIKVVFNKKNMGCGHSFRKGAKLATKDYVAIFPGDNDLAQESFEKLIEETGSADFITSFKANYEKRSFLRRFISRSFVAVMNFIFRLNLKYYTGPFVCNRKQMAAFNMNSNGLASIADYTVRFLKFGCSYKEIPFIDIGRKSGTTKALRLKSFFRTIKTIFVLLRDVYLIKNL